MESGAVQPLPCLQRTTGLSAGVSGYSFESTGWGVGISELSHPACFRALDRPADSGSASRSHEGQRTALARLSGDQVLSSGHGREEGQKHPATKRAPQRGQEREQESDDDKQASQSGPLPSPL